MTTATMVRGLVRAAEFLEQRDGGAVWDDSVRQALEEAQRRGWGKDQTGALDEVPVAGDVPNLTALPPSGDPVSDIAP